VSRTCTGALTAEFLHQPDALDLRGGALTADHVDILGSAPLNDALLKIAGGRGDLVKPHIGSEIERYVDRMKWD
jgi:phospholipid:diacylglycerol acyltransferase